MPTYTFICPTCHQPEDAVIPYGRPIEPGQCQACGTPRRRQWSRPVVIFKAPTIVQPGGKTGTTEVVRHRR